MSRARIKKGEMVLVISGKDRDTSTPRRVLEVRPKQSRVVVEGVNRIKRHAKPNPAKNVKGGILEKEAPIHLSNVMPVDPETKQPTRVGARVLADGTRSRVARRSGVSLDK